MIIPLSIVVLLCFTVLRWQNRQLLHKQKEHDKELALLRSLNDDKISKITNELIVVEKAIKKIAEHIVKIYANQKITVKGSVLDEKSS